MQQANLFSTLTTANSTDKFDRSKDRTLVPVSAVEGYLEPLNRHRASFLYLTSPIYPMPLPTELTILISKCYFILAGENLNYI
jgi:hypothetical protein